MTTRSEFSQHLSQGNFSQLERAVSFLWFYRQNQDYEERTASELSDDMSEEGFPHANVTRLRDNLLKTRYIVRGRRAKTFRLNLNYLSEITEKFKGFLSQNSVTIQDCLLPSELVSSTRVYLEKLVHQINGCYQFGFYDACIVLARRLMESLIIEIYISGGRTFEIKNSQGDFFQLDRLISYVISDNAITLSRNSPNIMSKLKELGDIAAHDRFYITYQSDIDDFQIKLRKLIIELLSLSGIKP